MTLPAPNLYFSSPHPWSAAIRSFSDISFMALVLQIEDAEDAFAKLRFASEKKLGATDDMVAAQRLKSVFSRCIVIDSTPMFLRAIDRKTLHAATIYVRKQLMDMTVARGIELLRGLLTGSPVVDGAMPNTVSSAKLRLTIHERNGQTGHLQILLSASADAETNSPIISNKVLHSLLDASSELLVGVTIDGKISHLNKGMQEIFGKVYFERMAQVSDLLTPASSVKFTQVSTMISMSGEPWLGYLDLAHPETGAIIPIRCRIALVSDAIEQRVTGYVISGLKETESLPVSRHFGKRSDAADAKARYEVVGKIAADMISDATGALAVIHNRSQAIMNLARKERDFADQAKTSDALIMETRKIENMRERIQSIVHVIGSLARDGAHEEAVSVNLTEMLAEVSDLVEHFAGTLGVVVDIDRPQQSLMVPMQRLRISQVLINLLINGCEAVQASDEKIVKLSIVCDDDWIYILVTDSGQSIPGSVRLRLFDPQFTTKKNGIPTGVGLSLSRHIAREHGGDLYFDDTSEKTRFVLELPLLRAGEKESEDSWEEI